MAKAKSAAAKLKAKRGRPRIEGVTREPNGRISRTHEPASKLALEARARMFRIPIEDAKDQQAGTFLGRLHMAFIRWEKFEKSKSKGTLQPEQSVSTRQYHALLSCQQAHNDFLKATGAPGAEYEHHLGSDGDPDVHAKWARSAKERWLGKDGKGGIRGIIYAAQEQERALNLWAAFDLCVRQDHDLQHMVPAIRTLGNSLAQHFNRR